MKFLQCLGDPAASCDSKSRELDVPLLDANGKKRGCVFCDVTVDKGFNVVWEDEELIAFRDRCVLGAADFARSCLVFGAPSSTLSDLH